MSDHTRLTELFARACELPAGERDAFLNLECQGDAELRAELQALLDLDGVDGEADGTERLRLPVLAAAEEIAGETADLDATVTRGVSAEGPADGEPAPSIAGYRVGRRLGSGGAGSVYEAHDEKMNRRVALKVLDGPAWLWRNLGRRFEREAWIAGKLSHPNIVTVYERGVSEGIGFYTMQLVDGGSLHDVIRRMRDTGRDDRLGLEFGSREYLQWALRQIILTARALDYAHGLGVVHRDVKPMNLLLGGIPAELRIADFGIAIDEKATRLTTEGQVIGTLRYMSPEQLRGRTAEVDRRTDVYALGVTLFELLTLEYPYRGDTYEHYMNAVLNDDARRPSKINDRISRDLEVVIGKALEKDPRDRYATAGEFADDLDRVMDFRPINAQPVGTARRLLKWARRKPVHAVLALALVTGIPTLGGVGAWALHQHRLLEQQRIATLVERLNVLAMSNRDEEIARVAGEILALDVDHPVGLRSRATSAFNLSKYELKNSPKQQHLLDIAFESVDRWRVVSPESTSPTMLKAHFLRQIGRADAARELEQPAPDREPDDDELYNRAHVAYVEGDLELAESLLSELLLRRRRPDAIQNRANVLIKLRRFDEARLALELLAALNPANADAPRGLGLILTEQGRHEDAERQLLHALQLDSSDTRIYDALSDNSIQWAKLQGQDAEAASRKLEEAEQHAREGLALDPNAPWLLINLGVSFVEQFRAQVRAGDPGNADLLWEAVAANARAAETTSAARSTALANRCDLLLLLGDLENALSACTAYVALEPEEALGYYNLAAVHALSGRRDEALEALERDLELGDDQWMYLRDDTWFESLRADPAFVDLLDRMRRTSRVGGVAP